MQKTNFPIELVIGEDCSTDGTREIVFEYQKKYPDIIRVITSDKNVGMKKNGYRTFKACRGKYIAFCEGDDYWHHPLKLQKQVDYIESHPGCGLVFSDFDVYNNKSNKIIRSINFLNGFKSEMKLTIENIMEWDMIKSTCSAMARKELCDNVIKSDPFLHQSENLPMGDLQLWAEIALISEAAYMPESLATYRVLDESASRSKDIKRTLRFGISGFEIRLYLCAKHKLSEDVRRKIELGWCDCSLRLAFYERDAKLALEVKKKKQRFTWKEWLRYFGAKYLVLNYVCRIAAITRNSFRKLLVEKRNGSFFSN